VQGNYIGTDATGTKAIANSVGVELGDGYSNTIGGTSAAARNIISGNSSDGVDIGGLGKGGTHNLVEGNYIGTNAAGMAALGNSGNGVMVASNNNTIGGTSTAARNIISGNGGGGVYVEASGVLVEGNFIGTDYTGTTATGTDGNPLGNSIGVEVVDGNSNTIGGTASGRNIISGNSNDGVLINGGTGNQVVGDFIGIDDTGANRLGNSGNGIEVMGSSNTIGSSVSESLLNIICANSKDGVLLDSGADDTEIWRSYLGINIHATALGNGTNGVEVQSDNNTIGGNPAIDFAYRNYISGNSNDGVLFDSGATGNQVLGAFIGLDTSGTLGAGNSVGIEIAGSSNTIGGTTYDLYNAISGNSSDGVLIDSGASGNLVEGNDVGTTYTGSGDLANGAYGVSIAGNNNTIGGSATGAANTIAYNNSGGVLVSVGTGDTISQNSIYANGSSNAGPGITLSNGGNNSIGAPSLSSATLSGSTLTVTGTFTATVGDTYALEFFANSSSDPEGRIFLVPVQVLILG
jgi:hypothetical protein